MIQTAQRYLDKARRALDAARRDLAAGDAENAIARAYFATYHAAAAALRTRGVSASVIEGGRHEEVHTRFYQLLVAEHLLERDSARTLALLYQLRKHADYLDEPFLSERDAREALAEAEQLVEGVSAWLAPGG
jgi:uncharacterized protein (UPF0332 family)